MSFEYVSVEEAIKGRGLRMVVVGEVPSPWGEAAKGFLHIKGVNWVAVRLAYDSEPLRQWAGQRSGPVAVYENERPRSGWAEILLVSRGTRRAAVGGATCFVEPTYRSQRSCPSAVGTWVRDAIFGALCSGSGSWRARTLPASSQRVIARLGSWATSASYSRRATLCRLRFRSAAERGRSEAATELGV
jgi:hypothetical protein